MPFEKGNQLAKDSKGGGRKGFEWEENQLKEMRDLLTNMLVLSKKIYKGTAKKKDFEAFGRLQKFGTKVMDKLHASRQQVEHDIGADTLDELTKFFRSIPKK